MGSDLQNKTCSASLFCKPLSSVTTSATALTSSICQDTEVLAGVNADPDAIGVVTTSADPLTIQTQAL